MDNLNKWSSQFEETDPLMRFEQMNLDEVQTFIVNIFQLPH